MTQHLTMLPRSAGGNDKKKILFHLDLGNKKSSSCKLCVHFGTSCEYKSAYIITSYCENKSIAFFSPKCDLCDYNL